MTASYAVQAQTAAWEGVAVVGEAVRRVAPESAEFVIEIAATAPTAAQALRDHQAKAAQIAQAVAPLKVQPADLQTISVNIVNAYAPLLPMLPAYGSVPQLGAGGYGAAMPALQPELQFGSFQARSLVRVSVREASRVGEIVDALTRAGATLAGGFAFHPADEGAVRKAALEAAGRDARSKAETLAAAAGRQVGDPLAIFEDVVASNGAYSALRAQSPWTFAPATPQVAGELEYYARVSASFRFQ